MEDNQVSHWRRILAAHFGLYVGTTHPPHVSYNAGLWLTEHGYERVRRKGGWVWRLPHEPGKGIVRPTEHEAAYAACCKIVGVKEAEPEL